MLYSEVFARPALGQVDAQTFVALIGALARQASLDVPKLANVLGATSIDVVDMDLLAQAARGRISADIRIESNPAGSCIGAMLLDSRPLALFLCGPDVRGSRVLASDSRCIAVTLMQGMLAAVAGALVEAAVIASQAEEEHLHRMPSSQLGSLSGWPDEFDLADDVLHVRSVERTVSISRYGEEAASSSMLKVVRRRDGTVWARGLHVAVPDMAALPASERIAAVMACVDAMVDSMCPVITLCEHRHYTYELLRAPKSVPVCKRSGPGGTLVIASEGNAAPAFRDCCQHLFAGLLS